MKWILGEEFQKIYNQEEISSEDLLYEKGNFIYADLKDKEVDSSGIYKSFYNNGETHLEFTLKNGNLNDNFKVYHQNGRLCSLIVFSNFIRKSLIGYYPDGELRIESDYQTNGEVIFSKEYPPLFLKK